MRMFLLLFLLEICLAVSASNASGELGYTYTIPGPHHVDVRKTLQCQAVASVVLREGEAIKDLEKGTLVAGITEAKHKLGLKMIGGELLVSEENRPAERYTIMDQGDAFVRAAWTDSRGPVDKAILLDKDKGYASWTRTKGTNSETEFLVCE